jgi:hypothetical protein
MRRDLPLVIPFVVSRTAAPQASARDLLKTGNAGTEFRGAGCEPAVAGSLPATLTDVRIELQRPMSLGRLPRLAG